MKPSKRTCNRELAKLNEGIAFSFPPPAIPGVGTSGGFTFAGRPLRQGPGIPEQESGPIPGGRAKRPELAGVNTTALPGVPQVYVDVDRAKVITQGVPLSDVYKTMQAFMGGVLVNYFNRFGRQWQVYVQAEGDYRTRAENLGQFYVTNRYGRARCR